MSEKLSDVDYQRVARLDATRTTAHRCAEIASIERDRIKHTSHHEGLGLGCVHHCEKAAKAVEDAIRREFLEER